MRLIKKINKIEPKRAFVFSQMFTSKNMRKKKIRENMVKVNADTFQDDLKRMRKKLLSLKEKELDRIIFEENKRRSSVYNELDWHLVEIGIGELGTWRGAAGIPIAWTKKNLQHTAQKISHELVKERPRYGRRRAMKFIPQIIKMKNILKNEKYLLPIVLQTEAMPAARKGVNKGKYFLDDGNLRAIAFAVSEDRKIKAYIGI